MSGQHPRSPQGPSRLNLDDRSHPRISSLPPSLLPYLRQGPSLPPDEDDQEPQLPLPDYASTRQLLPPLRSLSLNNQSRIQGEVGPTRRVLPPLQEVTPLRSGPRSTSASPASADQDDRQLYTVARQHRQDPYLNVHGSTPLAPRPAEFQLRQTYQPTPIHGIGVTAIVRPPSALDNAYLSDLSTLSTSSSARGAPPPSHTSAETSTSMSSESSRTRIRSWQREQDQGEGRALELELRAGLVGGEGGRLTPTYTEVEYERRHGRRAQAYFPVSSMRGGSVSSCGHSHPHGTGTYSPSASQNRAAEEGRIFEASIRPQTLRTPGTTPPAQAAAGPSNTSRSLAMKGKGKDDGDTKGADANAEEDELDETSDDEERPRFSIGSAPSRPGSAGGSRTPRTKIEVACDFCRKRKMKCDGSRPTCKNCQRKNVECSYIPIVRRRGPGKKQKTIDARPKKTNKRISADKKRVKGKGVGQASQPREVPTEGIQADDMPSQLQVTPPPQASGSRLRLESPTQHFPSGLQQTASELYLPSPLQHLSSPRHGGPSRSLPGAAVSPFSSAALQLPLYSPDHLSLPLYGHSAPFGGDLFLPGQSTTMGTGDIDDPYAGVHASIPEASGSTLSHVGHLASGSGAVRTASMLSSGPSSSEGEPGRHPRRRRTAKRVRTERRLEEGEIDETGPSSGAQGGSSGNQRLRR